MAERQRGAKRERAERRDVRPLHPLAQSARPGRDPGAALREAGALFGIFLHRLPSPCLLLQGERVLYANPAAEFFFGAGEAGLERLTIELLFRDAAGFAGRLAGARSGLESRPFRWICRRASGETVACEIEVAAAEAGGQSHALVHLRDLDEAPGAGGAERADVLGQLVGGIAHDFTSLLTALRGHLDLVADGELTAVQNDGVSRAARCAERAVGLSRRLMEFTRRNRFEPRVLSLDEQLRRMLPLFESVVRRDVRIVLEHGENLPRVRVDVAQLERALLNLLLNAQQAMPGGGPIVIRTTERVLDSGSMRIPACRPGRYALIEVRDTGRGIPFADQPHLFEPSFSTRPGGSGGLGLSVVWGIVKQHRGYIQVDSRPGLGTSVRVLLPAAEASPSGQPLPASSPSRETAAGAPATVLLVDDEQAIRELARLAIEAMGHRVLTAASAAEAERLFHEQPGAIDLLLTDLSLPDRAGSELVRQLRQRQPGLKVIVTSGYSLEELSGGDAGGGEGGSFLQKPFSLGQLKAEVQRRLASR